MGMDMDIDMDMDDDDPTAHRAAVTRQALRSLRKCRREGAAALSRACLALLRRDWADAAVKRRYGARDVGCFVRTAIHWAPMGMTMVQVRHPTRGAAGIALRRL